MFLSWFWTAALAISILSSILTGGTSGLAAGVMSGAQSGIRLALSSAGSLCLWSGFAQLAEAAGFTQGLSRLFAPLLGRLFPQTRQDPALSRCLSANVCANLLGLGNAATPMGIRAARHLISPTQPDTAGDSLCRLIVLNTASIQLIPTTLAAVRSSLGAAAPFDLLPAIWFSSLCSAAVGLGCAWGMGKLWKHG